MRRLSIVLLILVATSLSSACVASRKFVRNEVSTSADTLNTRLDKTIEKTNADIGEVRDGVTRVDGKVTAVDGRVSELDSKTSQRFEGVKGDINNVDQKAATAQSSADKASQGVNTLDEKFQNRNLYSVATEKAVLFKFDSAKLDTKFQPDLEEIVTTLQKNPDAVVVLEGRTDAKGDTDYNVKLGERRVDAVKRYLAVEQGIPIYRMHEISFGSAKPIAENKTREGREKNRAVVLTILVPKSSAAATSRNQPQNQ
jgi:outer membrane protein OmpA-like peptidoglycan-associated protein